ncbi:LOW QUALITY PROTEIN: afadin- and alpha-actinin-binding protein B-like [Haliotis rubra]|uniref:LOW QUALITY PROTEIN: afadin- and alpha-actinin-binding protein B-like n=1 Tax=Haliotis rubra TaxID=36100 RepID=UPI001EE60266|nr:LOW QUALITY PROTEIN: afadin- and alpha-actinin-binding protein B-like [Haliotis rubra]
MADWTAVKEQADDLIALYTSRTSSQIRMKDNHESQIWFPQTPGHSDGEATFCTSENLQSCLTFLDQELQVIGFASFQPEAGVAVSTVALVNRLYDILRLYQRSNRLKEELENRLHRCNTERDHYISTNARLKRENEAVEKNLARQEEKHRQLTLKHKTLTAKHKTDKEEVKRLQSVLQQKDVQARHEMKKQEKEAIKLKDRLHQLLADKNPARKIGMSMMNVLQRADGQRATWQNSGHKKEEEMYQLVIDNYEGKQKELMVENNDLRQCVKHMHRELASVLDRTSKSQPSPPPEAELSHDALSSSSSEEEIDDVSSVVSSRMTVDDLELSEGHYQMPYDIVRTDFEKQFKTVCKKIRKKMKKSADITPASVNKSSILPTVSKAETDRTSEELERLNCQMNKYKQIIKQQEELIQQSIQSQTKSVQSTFLHETQLLDEKECLSEQKKLFYQEKANFEEERRKFTEAAIKLGRERQAIQNERSNLLLKQFFNLTPFKEAASPRPKKEGARLLPATPFFSPAPGGKPKTPSTTDFYRSLGITPVVNKSCGVRKAASTESVRTTASKRSSGSTHSSPASLQLMSSDNIDSLRMKLFHKANSTAKDIEDEA